MTAQFSNYCAWLSTNLSSTFTFSRMTVLNTLMSTARNSFPTRQSTRDFIYITRNRFAQFMFSITPFLSQDSTWRAVGITVAVMKNFVITRMFSRTRFGTRRSSSTACHWWINYFSATLTIQFIEAAAPTWLTSACKFKNIYLICIFVTENE